MIHSLKGVLFAVEVEINTNKWKEVFVWMMHFGDLDCVFNQPVRWLDPSMWATSRLHLQYYKIVVTSSYTTSEYISMF